MVQRFYAVSGIYFAAETSATNQHIRTESKLLSKEGIHLYPSHAVRPKRAK